MEQDETQQYGDAQQTIIALQQRLAHIEKLHQIQQQHYEQHIGNLEEKLHAVAAASGAGASTHNNNDSDDDFFDMPKKPKKRKKIPRKNSGNQYKDGSNNNDDKGVDSKEEEVASLEVPAEDAGNMVTKRDAWVVVEDEEIVSESNPEEAELYVVHLEELGGVKQLLQHIKRFEVQIPTHKEDNLQFSSYNGLRIGLSEYEIETISKFIIIKSTKDFPVDTTLHDILNSDESIAIKWQMKYNSPAIPFTGTPFIYLGRQDYQCHQGFDKHAKKKNIYNANRLAKQREDPAYNVKTRKNNTKKLDCPIEFHVKKIFKFPSFNISNDSTRMRRKTIINLKKYLNQLRNQMKEGVDVKNSAGVVYITQFPNPLGHRNHHVGEEAGLTEPLDERVADYIKTQIRANCQKIEELKQRAELYVSEIIFNGEKKMPTHRRRFYPSKVKIRNLIKAVENETNRLKVD